MSTFARFALALMATLFAVGAEAQALFPPGSGVGLVPPKGMVQATTFSGFEDRANGASILTADLPPQAYAEILVGFTPEALAPSGFRAAGPAVDWPVAGGQARLLRGKQTFEGLVYRKWVLLAKGASGTAMLSLQAPEVRAAALPDAVIEAALKTVVLRAPPGLEDQVSALPFRLDDRADFRVVRVLGGSGVMLTEGPLDSVPDASQPVIVVASSLGVAIKPADQVGFAKQAFQDVGGISDLLTDKEVAAEAAGARTVRLEGRGVYRSSGEAVYVMQLIRFTPTGYLRVVGTSRSLDRERFAPRFTRLSESLKPR